MKTVDDILKAVKQLDATGFLSLRRKMDRLERKLWEEEHERTTAHMHKGGITNEDIDRIVTRRRRETRF
jgi:hypothetical protein